MTVESTPPDTPQMTRPEGALAWSSATSSRRMAVAFQSRRAPVTATKRSRMLVPCGVWRTSGWNWRAKKRRWRSAIAATPVLAVRARTTKPGGRAPTESP